MPRKLRTECWHRGDGVALQITCDDQSCLAEIAVPAREDRRLEIEILQRAKDAVGIACGPAVCCLRKEIQLQPTPNGKSLVGRFWLPTGLVRRVHELFYRVR